MSRIPCTVRIAGRYVYRRRLHFRNLISKHLPIALQTADPMVARRRAALLSARFAMVKLSVENMLADDRTFLSGSEIEVLFRHELEQELARNLADAFSNASHSSSVAEAARPLAEAYRLARRPNRPRVLSEADRADLAKRGLDGGDIAQVAEYLTSYCHEVSDAEVRARLTAVGVPSTDGLIEVARSHILRARADAWRRTEHVFDDAVMDAPNPLEALLGLEAANASAPTAFTAIAPDRSNSPFLVFDQRNFSESIDGIIADLRQEKVWKGDCIQQRRILQTFAWITGDKALGSYMHLDVEAFKRGLMRLPVGFRFGTPTSGAMARPFAEAIAALPPIDRHVVRNPKTVNRDLSTMSTVAKHLGVTAWKPAVPGAVIMNFAAATITIRDDGTDLRPPWTRAHMELLFHSPLYLGGSGSKARLRVADRPFICHDAAYFAPLLWYYHHACREEICGLRIDEVDVNHDVPHFVIKDNDIRGRDGELAGEKRVARRRALPVHPELLRLGFADYVQAIREEGHAALFPELYLHAAKRGGAQFYAIAWRFLVDWIGDRLPLPLNARGKGPDIHSIRALGSSFYELDGVNEIIRADVMGPARAGTNAKHYSKRLQTEGLDTVLRERLEFIQRYVPIISADVPSMPLRLLPIDHRSRVGSGRHRKMRSDRGVPNT